MSAGIAPACRLTLTALITAITSRPGPSPSRSAERRVIRASRIEPPQTSRISQNGPGPERISATWDTIIGSNLKGPFFLCQALAETLRQSRGNIITMIDIHGERPLAGHSLYSTAKAGLAMLTRSLARELAPDVRVNGISPGVILWPKSDDPEDEERRERQLKRVPLGSKGDPQDIAEAVLFLAERAPYVTGQIIAVDGGRSLT